MAAGASAFFQPLEWSVRALDRLMEICRLIEIDMNCYSHGALDTIASMQASC